MQILRILSFYLYICVYSFKYLQILHIGVIAMKNTNRQISSVNGRSTKKEKAGLSLLRPKLFTVVGDTYKYFNEVFQNILTPISKTISPFIARLTQKKFPRSSFLYTGSKIRIRFDSLISTRWIKFSYVPKSSLSSTVDFSF